MWDILLLDNSSSMLPNINLVEKGYNNLIEEQIKQGSTNKFTVITFNEEVEIIKDEKFPNVSKMEKGEYTTISWAKGAIEGDPQNYEIKDIYDNRS